MVGVLGCDSVTHYGCSVFAIDGIMKTRRYAPDVWCLFMVPSIFRKHYSFDRLSPGNPLCLCLSALIPLVSMKFNG